MTTCGQCRHACRTECRETRICARDAQAVAANAQACPCFAISARAYLERIENATRRMEDMSYRAQRFREQAMRATSSTEAARTSGTDGASKVSRNMDACIDLARDIDRRAETLRAQYETACEMIDAVQRADAREVLELRYLRGMRWEDIGKRMHYDERQVRRINRHALEDVQRQMDERGIRA